MAVFNSFPKNINFPFIYDNNLVNICFLNNIIKLKLLTEDFQISFRISKHKSYLEKFCWKFFKNFSILQKNTKKISCPHKAQSYICGLMLIENGEIQVFKSNIVLIKEISCSLIKIKIVFIFLKEQVYP